MEFIQDLLTAATQIIALAGFGGIAAHAIYKHYVKVSAVYAEVPATPAPQPQIEPDTGVDTALLTPDIPPQSEAIAEDIWDSGVTTSAPRYWVRQSETIKPALALMPAKEEIKAVTPTRKPATKKSQQPLEVNLNSLDSAALRKLCSKHGINWRDARGKGKHLTKAAMIFQLEQKATAQSSALVWGA